MIGVLMKVNSASLYKTGEALGTVAARRALSLLTLSVSDTQLVVDAHGAFECAVDHRGRGAARRTLRRFYLGMGSAGHFHVGRMLMT